jgi:hypothetical protein
MTRLPAQEPAQVFLATSDSAFVTGTELIVDGGVSHI